jgi:oxygen-independent coproporphyrinogen-3 oxidase
MGYTNHDTKLLIGLGASAISDCWAGLIQNEKKVEDYYKRIEQNVFPFFKGHVLSEEDLIMRRHILDIMCKEETSWTEDGTEHSFMSDILKRLQEFAKDKLIELTSNQLRVNSIGKPFIRNICSAFDVKLWAGQNEMKLFSSGIK